MLAVCAWVAPANPQDASTKTPSAGDPALEATLPLRFSGRLPGSVDDSIDGSFDIRFRIYLTPQQGDPIWEEAVTVAVEDGWMDVDLGRVEPIPIEIHEATFKFLGASVNAQREVYPRYPIVNVVYVSPKEALVANADRTARGAEAEGYGRDVSRTTEAAATWRAALARARALGGDLPSYVDWYRTVEAGPADEVASFGGHYEWVLPWVYDTASHGKYNRYFRGRFQGCDYMDLSPQKMYAYRVARLRASEAPTEDVR